MENHSISTLQTPDALHRRSASVHTQDWMKDVTVNRSVVQGLKAEVLLIDCNKLSRECFVEAFQGMFLNRGLLACGSIKELDDASKTEIDLIIYHSHSSDITHPAEIRRIMDIRAAHQDVRLVVLSDAEDAQKAKIVKKILDIGALGVVSTKTTGISMSLAVMQFILAGGTFVPPALLLSNRPENTAMETEKAETNSLTARQMMVLAQLDRGKANKLIAFELGMSESTVKVHVRNIMRKLSATNRTQAVYKARKLWSSEEMAMISDL